MASFEESLKAFEAEMDSVLVGKAEAKGYSTGGNNGGRDTLDAVAVIIGGDGHPPGEIVYKVKRWLAKGNPEDLVKIASWAFLMWDKAQRAKV